MRHLLRYAGVLLLLGIGAVHLYQYLVNHYRVIPIIGVLFGLNVVVAVLLGIVLAIPPGTLPGVRSIPVFGRAPHALLALGAAGFALGAIAGLLISEQATLFGFHEYGYRGGIVLALVLEAAAVAVLAGFVALDLRRVRARPSG